MQQGTDEGKPPELGRHVMADRDPKVLAMVERELKKDPKVSGAVLQKKARSINKEEAALKPRSFNARYPLPVRKKLAGTGGRKKGSGKKSPSSQAAKRASGQRKSGPVFEILERGYSERKEALNTALDAAYQKAISAGNLDEVGKLLTSIERTAKRFG